MNIEKYFLSLAVVPVLFLASCSSLAQRERHAHSGRVRPQMYVFESDGAGFNTKNFFYDNGQEVVVFDTQFTPDTAKKSIEFLRTKTSNPITYVVVTHPNPDKFNGMSVFQARGAKVIASRATSMNMRAVHEYKKYYFVQLAKMFADETYPRLSSIDVVFEKAHDITLGNGEKIHLAELSSPGVSLNQTVAHIPSLNALMVGDLIHHKTHAWLEGGIVNGKPTPTMTGWISDLNELSALFGSLNPTVYGGRGEAVPLNNAVISQIAYLEKADSIVSTYVSSLGAKKSELQTDKMAQHAMALQGLFEKAYPQHKLGYMIQYGVYGLAQSK